VKDNAVVRASPEQPAVTEGPGVAALYIDPRGPYPALLGADACWDEARDARLYEGPWPVVAHPPCRNWGSLRHLATADDSDCGPRAVEQVRRWGGVLEHPARSTLWAHCGLPKPGELPDAYEGRTIEVCQVDWGHVARKRTWLYLVGVESLGQLPPAREPTHWCSGFRSSTHDTPKRYKQNGRAVVGWYGETSADIGVRRRIRVVVVRANHQETRLS
jgi:hypothetical protein